MSAFVLLDVLAQQDSRISIFVGRYMMEVSRQNPDMRDLESLISGIQQVRLPASSFWFHLCHLLGRPASFDYLFR
jgi:hypothetical protein